MITVSKAGYAVLLGYGTVSIGTTAPDGGSQYLLLENMKQAGVIGSEVGNEGEVETSNRIMLVFDKPESVDVFISSLQEIKRNLTPIRRISNEVY